jgi:hypothetical protein
LAQSSLKPELELCSQRGTFLPTTWWEQSPHFGPSRLGSMAAKIFENKSTQLDSLVVSLFQPYIWENFCKRKLALYKW